MLRIEGKQTESAADTAPRRIEGEGLMIVGVLIASWMIAIGVGWVIWKMAPL